MDFFTVLTPVTYLILILLWLLILSLYLREVRRHPQINKTIKILLLVFVIDAGRTLFESFYFGAWYSARVGFLPHSWFELLVQPQNVFIPKAVNVVAAGIILAILVRRWVPTLVHDIELQELQLQHLHREVEERKRHAQLVAASTDLLSVLDHQYVYRLVNQPYLEAFDKKREEIIGHSVTELLGGEIFSQLKPRLDRAFAGERIKYQAWFDLKNWGRRFLEIQYHPLEDASGGKRHVVVNGRDITEQKQAMEALEESETRFRSYFDLGLVGLAVTSLEKGWVHFNSELCDILGQTPETLKKLTWAEITHPDDLEEDVAHFNQVLAGETDGYAMDKRFIQPDGAVVHASISVRAIRAGEGPVDHFVAMVQDITDRKRAEAYLRANERRLHMLLELNRIAPSLSEKELCDKALDIAVEVTGSRIGYLHLVNPDQKSIRLVTWNAATLEMCEAVHETDYPLDQAGIWADSIRRKRPVIHNDYPNHPDRKGYPKGHFPVTRHMSAPALEGDRVRLIVGVGEKESDYDDNDMVQLQLVADEIMKFLQRLRGDLALKEARREAEEANRAKSQFLASMSHEIRTPLNAIIGVTEMLGRADLGKELQDQVRLIETSGENLLALVNDILDFSKIEAGRLELDDVDFDMEEQVGDLDRFFREAAASKGILYESHLHDDLGRWHRGDPLRLKQILINLISNGIKFTDAGSVVLTVFPGEESGSTPVIHFEVRDTGIGISPDHFKKLFKTFSQVDSSVTRRFGGTGLGLAISHRLAALMSGAIEVESQPGEGSLFRLILPLPPGAPQGETVMPSPLATGAVPWPDETHILIVEDDPINQAVVSGMLKKFPVTVSLVSDGADALNHMKSKPVDLVLMDCQMPGMDGFQATRLWREHESANGEKPRIPIVALTAFAMKGDRDKCLTAGMDDYLSKPVRLNQLQEVILKWRDGSV